MNGRGATPALLSSSPGPEKSSPWVSFVAKRNENASLLLPSIRRQGAGRRWKGVVGLGKEKTQKSQRRRIGRWLLLYSLVFLSRSTTSHPARETMCIASYSRCRFGSPIPIDSLPASSSSLAPCRAGAAALLVYPHTQSVPHNGPQNLARRDGPFQKGHAFDSTQSPHKEPAIFTRVRVHPRKGNALPCFFLKCCSPTLRHHHHRQGVESRPPIPPYHHNIHGQLRLPSLRPAACSPPGRGCS